MLTRVITLRFSELIDGFDDGPLREFIKDKELVSVQEHFFTRLDQPYLAMIINYKLKPIVTEAAIVSQTRQQGKRRDDTWKDYVPESEVPLFNTLRDWRAERGKMDGVPPYVIFTNRELASILVARPTTLGQLGQIPGVGAGKVKSYGGDLLTILGRHSDLKIPETDAGEPTYESENR